MIHGNKERFAIQWELHTDSCGKWMYGQICYWIQGQRVGDYNIITSLADVLTSLMYPVGDCGRRVGGRLCTLNGKDAYNTLHAALFEGDPSLADEANGDTWARFDVSLLCDVFTGWRLYILDCESDSRLLVGHRPKNSSTFEFWKEIKLFRYEFDKIVIAFHNALIALEESQKPLP